MVTVQFSDQRLHSKCTLFMLFIVSYIYTTGLYDMMKVQ